MWYIGLDMHSRCSTLCILDEHGKRVSSEMVVGPWPSVIEQLRATDRPFSVCCEASLGNGVKLLSL